MKIFFTLVECSISIYVISKCLTKSIKLWFDLVDYILLKRKREGN